MTLQDGFAKIIEIIGKVNMTCCVVLCYFVLCCFRFVLFSFCVVLCCVD